MSSTYFNLIVEELRSAGDSGKWENVFHLFLNAYRFKLPSEQVEYLRQRIRRETKELELGDTDHVFSTCIEDNMGHRWAGVYPDDMRYFCIARIAQGRNAPYFWITEDYYALVDEYLEHTKTDVNRRRLLKLMWHLMDLPGDPYGMAGGTYAMIAEHHIQEFKADYREFLELRKDGKSLSSEQKNRWILMVSQSLA